MPIPSGNLGRCFDARLHRIRPRSSTFATGTSRSSWPMPPSTPNATPSPAGSCGAGLRARGPGRHPVAQPLRDAGGFLRHHARRSRCGADLVQALAAIRSTTSCATPGLKAIFHDADRADALPARRAAHRLRRSFRLRSAIKDPGPFETVEPRRARSRHDALHVRLHREAEGRAPLARVAALAAWSRPSSSMATCRITASSSPRRCST